MIHWCSSVKSLSVFIDSTESTDAIRDMSGADAMNGTNCIDETCERVHRLEGDVLCRERVESCRRGNAEPAGAAGPCYLD